MRVATGVEMLELNLGGFVLCPTLVWDEDTAVLIDSGMPGTVELIRDAMTRADVSFDALKALVLTHQDIDHIGSAPAVVQAHDGRIEVYAHELDKPYIEGDLTLLKADMSRMSEETLKSLPETLRTLYANLPTVTVTSTIQDGEVLPLCGGIRVIFTPGHTPGHVSLYLERSKTLVAGDAMVSKDGVLMRPVPRNTPDMETAIHSLGRFLDLDVESVICYHGGLCEEDVQAQLRRLVDQSGQ